MNGHEWLETNELKGIDCQKCSETLCFFLRFLSETELSLKSRAPFAGLIFPKALTWSFSFWRCLFEIELLPQSRAHFVDHFPRSRHATAETENVQRRPQTATLPQKNTGIAFPVAHASELLDGNLAHTMMWYHVVDMMVRQLAMTIVRNLEVSLFNASYTCVSPR